MEKPFLTIESKDFVTGIAPSAHSEKGGLFYKAKGISPINEPGITESTDNWLLRAGPLASDLDSGGTVVVDNAIARAIDYGSSTYLYLMGDTGHFYQVTAALGVTDLKSGGAISDVANGMVIYPVGGTKYCYYFQKTQIGRFDLSSTFVDNYVAASGGTVTLSGIHSTTMHPTHRFHDRVYWGNLSSVGSIKDDGTNGVTFSSNDLDIPADSIITAISDDGIYLAIAITDNTSFVGSTLADCRILFWDTSSDSWQREYRIPDQFIHSLTRQGNTIIAQGKRGIYQVSFDGSTSAAGGGVKVLASLLTGLTSTSSVQLSGPYLGGIYKQNAYLFAHDSGGTSTYSSIGSLGKLSIDAPSAFMEPLIGATANHQFSLIETEFLPGKVIAGLNNKLYSYTFSGDSAATGVNAQTVYFHLPQKIQITRIDVIFGEPLASGDSVSLFVFTDEDTSSQAYGSAITYAAYGAIRRKQVFPNTSISADQQFSLEIQFNAGTPKIQRIEIYGQTMTP